MSDKNLDQRMTMRVTVSHVAWSLARVFRVAPAAAVGYALLQVLEGINPAFTIWVTRNLVDTVLAGAGRGAAGLRPALPWLLGLAAVLWVAAAAWCFWEPIEMRLRLQLHAAVGRDRLAKASRLPLRFFEESGTWDQIERTGGPGDTVTEVYASTFTFLSRVLGVLSVAWLFASVSPWIALAMTLAVLPMAFWQIEYSRAWTLFTYHETERQRRVSYLDRVLNGRAEQKELRVFGLNRALQERWIAQRHAVTVARTQERLRLSRGGMLATLPDLAGGLAAAGALLWQLDRHALSTGSFVALVMGMADLREASGGLGYWLGMVNSRTAKVGYVRQFLDLQEDEPGRRSAPFPLPLQSGIRFADVTFSYPGREQPVLVKLNLHLQVGQRVALVGENGAGKSTLAKHKSLPAEIQWTIRAISRWSASASSIPRPSSRPCPRLRSP